MSDEAASLTQSDPSQRKVAICVQDGRSYVWSASDVIHLRSQHRLIGILTGSLPLLPQQNAYLGLPLQLMPEETLLLVSRNAAILVDSSECHSAPTTQQWEDFVRAEEEDRQRQREASWRGTVEQKKAFEAVLKKAKNKKANKDEHSENASSQDIPPSDLSSYPYSHITHDASDALPWYALPSDPVAPHLLSQLKSHPTRQLIFNHLNSQGYYLSCGLRFGGDFVVYPGDPFRYHSHYTMTCPEDASQGFSVGKLIADGRLGTAVKKVHLIASVQSGSDETQDVTGKEDHPPLSFYSLTWAGFGT